MANGYTTEGGKHGLQDAEKILKAIAFDNQEIYKEPDLCEKLLAVLGIEILVQQTLPPMVQPVIPVVTPSTLPAEVIYPDMQRKMMEEFQKMQIKMQEMERELEAAKRKAHEAHATTAKLQEELKKKEDKSEGEFSGTQAVLSATANAKNKGVAADIETLKKLQVYHGEHLQTHNAYIWHLYQQLGIEVPAQLDSQDEATRRELLKKLSKEEE